jgi:hypothetical protein
MSGAQRICTGSLRPFLRFFAIGLYSLKSVRALAPILTAGGFWRSRDASEAGIATCLASLAWTSWSFRQNSSGNAVHR